MDKLSSRGDAATAFERELVELSDTSRVTDALGQWLLLAQRFGLDVVLAVMDEFGGDETSVPTRRGFIKAIYRPLRDEAIRLRLSQGATLRELRAEFGISNSQIMRLRSRMGGDAVRPNRVHRRR